MINIYLLTFILAFAIQIIFFLFANAFKTDKVTDLAYGLTFVFLAWFILLTRSSLEPVQVILTWMVTLWGVRLAVYLFIRILKMGEDKRFDQIRKGFVSFLKFWLFQALTIWVIMLPSTYILSQPQLIHFNLTFWTGIIIFCLGLLIETVADWQKFVFKNNPINKGKWIESGIWKYSRHPNYFGEMTLWWGIFILTLGWQNSWSYLTIIGPIFITFILLKVSGIPLLEKRYEKKYKDNPDYQAYKNSTNLLIPWWPKRS